MPGADGVPASYHRSGCDVTFQPYTKRDGMTFTSLQFGILAGVVFGLYYLPILRALQVQLLVAASLFFYSYGQPELLPLLAMAVFGTYLFLILALRNRSIWLPIGIIFNLTLLAF